MTGRKRTMPASITASSNGSPSSCFSSMKSKRTMTWLTITPIRLATPRKAMKPKGVPMIHKAATAPTTPYGAAANTSRGLTALLNWKTRAKKIPKIDAPITIANSSVLLVVVAAHADFVAGGKRFLEGVYLWHGGLQNFRGQHPRPREAAHSDGPKVVEADNAVRFH